ncbi:protein rep [Thermobifida cellulosilytica]|uniref:Uncharacterized protein n=1 Tax=Thermobifida cellulosilytica TB100 TaxID=665004 RepID=A0A147KMC6_THECS|nr:protein rep [Thermobifida cellulosilytica]KUP98388.1 hypothetical protein AC529_01680 [Thermobifida cellulosilytica TB100]
MIDPPGDRVETRGTKSPQTHPEAVGASPSETPAAGRLGSTGGSTTRAGQQGCGGGAASKKGFGSKPRDEWRAELRDEAWRLQDVLREITRDKAARDCNHAPVSGGATLVAGGGGARYTGLATCGKIHLCPVCSGRIRSARAVEMEAYVEAWERAGGGVVLATFTLRHYQRHGLQDLVKLQHAAWSRAFGAKAGKMWVRLKDEFGIVGYARAWEVTHGANGWHPHWHVLVFVADPWSEERAEEFRMAAYARWAAAVAKEGGYLPSEKRGVRIDVPNGDDSVAMARYLVKADKGVSWRLGSELTRADAKRGRNGRRTPFEILGDTADESRTEAQRAADVRLWHEYESASHGVRALWWSTKIRDELAKLTEVDERTDAEIAAEVDEDAVPIAVVPSATWYGHIVTVPGRKLALVQAAERNGQAGVRWLIKQWGLQWGRDVLPPPTVDYVDDEEAERDREQRARLDARERPAVRPEARLPVGRATEVAPEPERPSQGVLVPEPPHVADLDVLAAMCRANRARAEAGIARLRERGLLAPVAAEPKA